MGYICMYHKVLAHTVMKTEKSHNLPSMSRRVRKASGVVQRPENQRADGTDSRPRSPRAGVEQCPSSAIRPSEVDT